MLAVKQVTGEEECMQNFDWAHFGNGSTWIIMWLRVVWNGRIY